MVSGILFTSAYIIYFNFPALIAFLGMTPVANTADNWFLGISPEGIGTVGMLINFAVTTTVTCFTPAPPESVQRQVEMIRHPGEMKFEQTNADVEI